MRLRRVRRHVRGCGLWAFAALAAMSAACELTTIEVTVPRDMVVVEGYLRSDRAAQSMFLYRTLHGGDRLVRVDDAEVQVLDDEGAQLLFTLAIGDEDCTESPVGSCYISPPRRGFIRPGATYRLEVRLADGGMLTGATTLPGEFDIVAPAEPRCVFEDTSYPITWTASEGAWSYQIVSHFHNLAEGLRERGVADPPDELELVGLAVGGADTTIVFPGEFGVFDRFAVERDLLLALAEGLPSGSRADIVLAAGDRNYVNWVRGGNFNPSGQVRVPSVGGDGTGVFGSIVVHRRSLLAEDDGSGIPSCQ